MVSAWIKFLKSKKGQHITIQKLSTLYQESKSTKKDKASATASVKVRTKASKPKSVPKPKPELKPKPAPKLGSKPKPAPKPKPELKPKPAPKPKPVPSPKSTKAKSTKTVELVKPHKFTGTFVELSASQKAELAQKIADNINDETFFPEIERAIFETPNIAKDFTSALPHKKQQELHDSAFLFLSEHLPTIGTKFTTFQPPYLPGNMNTTEVGSLNSDVFTWEESKGVQGDIQRDGKYDGLGDGDGDGLGYVEGEPEPEGETIFVYGAASQFNGAEAMTDETLKVNTAVENYKKDRTQGPQAQLQFSKQQVELINCGANIGYNALSNVLDESTKDAVKHGYLMPNDSQIEAVISQIRTRGQSIEYIAVKSKPVDYSVNPPRIKSKKVHMLLVSAPAFGRYASKPYPSKKQMEQLQYACAFCSYIAQFQYLALYAEDGKKVVFKPCATGLGVFENNPIVVAKAFYDAAKMYEENFEKWGVEVRFQVFRGKNGGPAYTLVQHLKLRQYRAI